MRGPNSQGSNRDDTTAATANHDRPGGAGSFDRPRVWYWLGCEATVLLLHVLWRLSSGSVAADPLPATTRAVWDLLPALLGALLVLPLVIVDVLRLSNRFVGPIWNLRNALKRTELGDPVPPVPRRPADFWPDLLERVNRLLSQRQDQCDSAARGAASRTVPCPVRWPMAIVTNDRAAEDGGHDRPVVGARISDGRPCCARRCPE